MSDFLSECDQQNIREIFDGRSVLVTGGTGSFGQHFIRTVLRVADPLKVIVFSRDELKQHEMQTDSVFEGDNRLRFFLGDVRDRERLNVALREVDYVVHAAALKQVPAAEYNPIECIRTNIFGAENVIAASQYNGVKRVIALSTDKACAPVNLYGATKLASDKLFVAANNMSGTGGPTFAVVRYGNVIGSRGSVIPYFRRLIDAGWSYLPITDPRMTRFWISIQAGVSFVLSSFLLMRGGEIFVPKIPSMRLVDLATAMAPELQHRITGIRPGEKLHEVMIGSEDARNTVSLADRFVIEPAYATFTRQSFEADGYPLVDQDFTYASDTNPQWLNEKDLSNLMKDLKQKK